MFFDVPWQIQKLGKNAILWRKAEFFGRNDLIVAIFNPNFQEYGGQ